MAKFNDITVGINIDMQKYYDDLVLYKKTIDVQIEVLANEPNICTHIKTEQSGELIVCANSSCRKVINSGKYDCCR